VTNTQSNDDSWSQDSIDTDNSKIADVQPYRKRLRPIRALKQSAEILRDYGEVNNPNPRDSTEIAEHQENYCKDQVYLSDNQEAITVTLGHCQTQVKTKQAIAVTIIGIAWWSQYLNWNSARGNIHATWKRFRRMPRKDRMFFSQIMWLNEEEDYRIFGLFQAMMMIGSVEVISMIYVT
jgi:hypothetical protein